MDITDDAAHRENHIEALRPEQRSGPDRRGDAGLEVGGAMTT